MPIKSGAAPALSYQMSQDAQGSRTGFWMHPESLAGESGLCVLPQVAQPPPVMGRGILEQGPFPGSILVAAAAVLAGAGFIGSKLYKAKAPEVRKVRCPLRDCLKRASFAVSSFAVSSFAVSRLIKALCNKQL